MIYGCTCGGRFKVYAGRTVGFTRVKYLKCDKCDGTQQVSVQLDADGKEFPNVVLAPSTDFVEATETTGRIEATKGEA